MRQPPRRPEGYIRLHRSLLEWEWFQDSPTLHVFIYLLLIACFKPIRHAGVELAPGQLITARRVIARSTGLSEQQVRTALRRLQKTGEITLLPTRSYSLVTMTNYAHYQALLSPAARPADSPPPARQPPEKKNDHPVHPDEKRGASHDTDPSDGQQARNGRAGRHPRNPAEAAQPQLYAGEFI